MPADAAERTTRRPVDEAALQRTVARLQRAPQAPWLHGEAARRLGERLPIVKLQPRRVIDWWPHVGGGAAVLACAYPKARVLGVQPAGTPTTVLPWWSTRRWSGSAEVAANELEDGQAQLVWSNMMLHAVADPLQCLRDWHRALAVDGFLMFSTLGPGTLASLRSVYASQGWGPPMAPLVDMHDLGDMLVEAGFADPVMDQEILTLTWSDADQALQELRSLGSNVDPARMPGLRTPRWRGRLAEAIERVSERTASARIELTFELVYGHAFKPAPRHRVSEQAEISLNDMRAMVRVPRQSPR
jgi:malonyl-CoA O-methyltransferase